MCIFAIFNQNSYTQMQICVFVSGNVSYSSSAFDCPYEFFAIAELLPDLRK